MMTLLVPLGLLGLLGILALIIIYIIRPNYQVKHVASTYIWKLSLKYRRKRLPTSPIRNILIFLCQFLILTLIAAILAMPVIAQEREIIQNEVIVIIDSSASMYAGNNGNTRFLRAVDGAEELARSVFARGGYVSVILADDDPEYIAQRMTSSNAAFLYNELSELTSKEYACYFGASDIDGAMSLCEEVLSINSSAQIHLFTDTKYDYVPDKVTVEWDTVVGEFAAEEWNAAILDAYVERVDNFYALTVEVAYYGNDNLQLEVNVEVAGANSLDQYDAGESISLKQSVFCEPGVVKKVIFREQPGDGAENTEYYTLGATERFTTYKDIHITVDQDDCFKIDNTFDIYGGQKDVLRIQYASSLPNPFFTGALDVFTNRLSSKFNVQFVDVPSGRQPATSGFDFYIFEHTMPDSMPTDGVVFLVDPDKGPSGSGIFVNDYYTFQDDVALTQGAAHPLTQYINADNILLQQYCRMTIDPSYEVLLTCDGNPVYFAQKNENFQVAVLGLNLHYSYLPVRPEFYIMLYNMFEYFFPSTVEKNAFSVGEKVALNSRGPELTVFGYGTFAEFPASVSFDLPGTYTVTTTSYFNSERTDVNLFIKIPAEESNVTNTADSLTAPYRDEEKSIEYDDLLIYLAAAMVLLLFVEWLLHWRESR